MPELVLSGAGFPVLFLSGAGLALLCGLVLPSSVIATSPIEFSFLGETSSPLSYLLPCFCVFLGFFVFWSSAVYCMFGRKLRIVLPPVMFAFLVCAFFNVYVFKASYGNLDASFNLADTGVLVVKSPLLVLIPLELLLVSAAVCMVMAGRGKAGLLSAFLFACNLGMAGLSSLNVKKIGAQYAEYAANLEKYGSKGFLEGGIEPVYHLSKTGKNVIVLFLDQEIGPYTDEIFEEFPDIREAFDGFTWFPNTISFDAFTLQGSPPIYGGYEYNQEAMNAREDELLRVKNTEAHLMTAKIFSDGGYSALLTDPPWVNLNFGGGDYSVYGKCPEVTVLGGIEGKYMENFIKEKGLADYNDADMVCKKQIVNFSLLQVLFPLTRKSFYMNLRTAPQNKGISSEARNWLHDFSHLYYLPMLTDFNAPSEKKGAFVIMHSMATHEVRVSPGEDLESPAVPQPRTSQPVADYHYRVDAATLKQLGKYFDYLRENGCYDNTRIIVVSDHGYWQKIRQWVDFKDFDLMNRNCALLLYKDFDSDGSIMTDNTFMTNADTLYLAKEGLELSDENPFTGKKLVPQKDGGVNVYRASNWDGGYYKEKTQFELTMTQAWHISDNIYEEKNWIPLLKWENRQRAEGDAQ